MRLFVAIDPPEEIRQEVAALWRGLGGARWVPAGQLHVTLRFLGEVDPAGAARLLESLESVAEPAFSLLLAGGGRFPPRRQPRVLWIGLEPEERLRTLHSAIERRLEEAGFPSDGKPFSPHLTVARLKEHVHADDVERWLESARGFRAGPFPVSRFCLYSSVLGRDGAAHRKEREYPLAGA